MLRTLRVYIYKSNFLAEISKKGNIWGPYPIYSLPEGPWPLLRRPPKPSHGV